MTGDTFNEKVVEAHASEVREMASTTADSAFMENVDRNVEALVRDDPASATELATRLLDDENPQVRFEVADLLLDRILAADPAAALPLYERAFTDSYYRVGDLALVQLFRTIKDTEIPLDEFAPFLRAMRDHRDTLSLSDL